MKQRVDTIRSFRVIAFLIFISVSIAFSSCSSAKEGKEGGLYSLSAQMSYHPLQCSGTLNGDFLMSVQTLPLSNTIFYIKKGKLNSVSDTAAIKVKTDENGKFTIQLPAGEYVLLHQFQKDTMTINTLRMEAEYYLVDNEQKLMESYMRPIAALTIADTNLDSLKYLITTNCFTPAGLEGISYIGPMPE